MGQSIVLGEIKAEIPLQKEKLFKSSNSMNKYMERTESLSPESKVSRFCVEGGFMHVVEVGQYFVTKDTDDFRQFCAVACREHMDHHNQEDGFRETRELDVHWKSRPVICAVNMELKLESGLWVKTILILGSDFSWNK